MKQILLVFLLAVSCLGAWPQTPLEKPLRFVAGEDIMILSQGNDNLVLRIMGINPFLAPKTTTLAAEEEETFRKLYQHGVSPSGRTPDEIAKLFLVSGDARYAAALDSIKQSWLPRLDIDSTRQAGARDLLNTLPWIAAVDDRGVYVNLLDDCMINVRTDSLRFTLDQIREPDCVKYRISGLPHGRMPIVVRLRIPSPAPKKFYLNGRALLDEKIENGYLVLDRRWRNNEEVFYNSSQP